MKRPLIFVVTSFILGIVFMNIKRTIFYMALLFCAAFLIFYRKVFTKFDEKYLISKERIKKEKIIKLILIMLIAFMCGYLYSNANYSKKINSISKFENQEVSLAGVIVDKEDNEYLLKNVHIDGKKIDGKIKLRSQNECEVLDEISSGVIIQLPSTSMNFGGFDYRQYLYSKNIVGIAEELYSEEKVGVKLNYIEAGSIKIREYISEVIDNSYPAEEAQILKAVIIGKSSTLQDDVREDYQKAGIIHILVVSGAHIVLVIASIKLLMDRLKISKRWYNFILIFLIIIYIYITGAGESVLRAGIVSIIVLLAGVLGRQNDNITTMFTSAFVLTLINPMIIYSVGFQLSFAGALGIILLNNKIVTQLSFLPKIVAEALSVGISAQLFILPITALHFNSINLMGMIASLVVMPIIDLVMSLGFVSIFPIIRKIVVPANCILIKLLSNDAKIFSQLNVLELVTPTPMMFQTIVYYMWIITCCMCIKNRRKTNRFFILVLLAGVAFAKFKPQDLELNFLYVGHGDSIFMVTPDKKTILIDTGDNYTYDGTEYNIAERTVIPFILDKGYKKIDLMILSHLDSDHAGGTETILEKLDVKQMLIGKNSINSKRFEEILKVCEKEDVKINLVDSGDKFNIGEIKFNVLSPFKELKESENNNSVVIKMEYKGSKTLFMGDLEVEGEEVLLKRYNIDADILKVGHHGSITSTTQELVDKVTPDISVISLGERFASLPSKEVLERLSNSNVYQTNKDGGINVTISKKGKITVKTAMCRGRVPRPDHK